MPKVVVYVRAEDARAIEATEGREIQQWVRAVVRDEIKTWHDRRAYKVGYYPADELVDRKDE